MTPTELRELADKAEGVAIKHAFEAANEGWSDHRGEQAEKANRLFLMARNLRERAREIEYDAARVRPPKLANEDIQF